MVVVRARREEYVAELKARDMVAAAEKARQRGCREERRRAERRRKQIAKDRQAILAARQRDREAKIERDRFHDGAQMVYRGAGFVTMQQAMEQAEARAEKNAQDQERRRLPMDVLDVVDVSVKGNNMVVKKNSKKKTDVAKEENGERLIK